MHFTPPSQTELDFSAKPEAAEAWMQARLAALVELLRKRGWMTRRELEREGFGDRELRLLVEWDAQQGERAPVLFSYPGAPGYKAFGDVTVEEFRRAGALRSQGEAMVARWLRYQRAWHALGRNG